MKFTNEEVSKHFDELAPQYGESVAKNYYSSQVRNLIKSFIKDAHSKNVLEVGCGRGDFLEWLNPRKGVGIDVSKKMIDIANKSYDGDKLSFYVEDISNFKSKLGFDYIVLIDVIEHLFNVEATISSIVRLSDKETITLMSFSNPFWEVPFKIFEFLKIKDPEGPHNLMSIKKLSKMLRMNGFEIIDSGYRLILPLKIPFISKFFNSFFYKTPFFRNLGMTQYIMCKMK